MYFLSSGVMVGWAAGLSYDTRIQNIYQNIPKLPGRGRERVKATDMVTVEKEQRELDVKGTVVREKESK